MNMHVSERIEPQVIERTCGGWLAISPRWCPVRIGAAGSTEEEARQKFAQLLERWAAAREAERLGAGLKKSGD